ncbi:unnamed protein product [Parnassius mnemosyne]|uniref:Uncharacterized protein n=1 Tax=Parnassius mnemosyne TaxID=213953 RepID=A0AAV1M9J8_9NEOP
MPRFLTVSEMLSGMPLICRVGSEEKSSNLRVNLVPIIIACDFLGFITSPISKSMELKALLKSSSTSTVKYFWSIPHRISSVTLRRAVVVL